MMYNGSVEYSDYDMENTAKAVWIMNESAREKFANWRELESEITGMAYRYANDRDATSISTGGFSLAFTRRDDRVYVTPSVSSFTALSYTEDMNRRLDTIRSLTE